MWLTACCIHCSKHNCTDSSFALNIKRWQFLFTKKLKHFYLKKDEWARGKLCPFLLFSIYEKLIQFCSIDELGTNYPKVRCGFLPVKAVGESWCRAVSSCTWLSLACLFRGPARELLSDPLYWSECFHVVLSLGASNFALMTLNKNCWSVYSFGMEAEQQKNAHLTPYILLILKLFIHLQHNTVL